MALWKGIDRSQVVSPHHEAKDVVFWRSSLKKLLKDQSSFWWSKVPWLSIDTALMETDGAKLGILDESGLYYGNLYTDQTYVGGWGIACILEYIYHSV